MADWQPIETAPRDGTEFIACWQPEGYDYQLVNADTYWWGRGECFISHEAGRIEPTHWMPLPAPPKVQP